jgi:hypothetical protein
MSRREEMKEFIKAWAEYALNLENASREALTAAVGDPALHQQITFIEQKAMQTFDERIAIARELALAEFARARPSRDEVAP